METQQESTETGPYLQAVRVNSPSEFQEHIGVLYGMLARRPAVMNISHKEMPSFLEHKRFVESDPYAVWCLIKIASHQWAGQVYLTMRDEIGVQILPEFQRTGLATWAVKRIMENHKGPLLANVNPNNRKSIAFFRKLGFEIIQSTYKLG
jgi:RimJ/RimL family protein N-acetyltransferase